MLSPSRRRLEESQKFYYPFNDNRVGNVLEDSLCHSVPGDGITKVLFLHCGDLMGVLQASTNEHIKNLHIHLNSNVPSILARNILILKVISEEDFNPNNERDIAFLWDVWYNLEWGESTKKRFVEAVKFLLDGQTPANVSIPKSCQLECLRDTWNGWCSVLSKTRNDTRSLATRIQKERSARIGEVESYTFSEKEKATSKQNGLFFTAVNSIVLEQGKKCLCKIEHVKYSLHQNIMEEIRHYFQRGTYSLGGEDSVCYVNPTMLLSKDLKWELFPRVCPFDGYIPFTNEELDTSAKEKVLILSCQKILQSLVSSYRRRQDSIKIFFHLEDPLEYCYTEKNTKFDVIESSRLAEEIGLSNVITACNGLLADHLEAVLLTTTFVSLDSEYLSIEKYLEAVLCCPLSMIPTIYGLRLADHVKLGLSSPNIEEYNRRISWKKAMKTFENVVLSLSPVINQCLDRLAKKCFAPRYSVFYSPVSNGDKTELVCHEIRWYSPLTFHYVVSSMMRRISGSCSWLPNVYGNVSPVFQLAKTTQEAWRNGQPILKLTAKFDLNSSTNDSTYYFKKLLAQPLLRFVLVAFEGQYIQSHRELVAQLRLLEIRGLEKEAQELVSAKFPNTISFPNVHAIDNFHFQLKNTSDENTADVTFLLPPDHGLGKTHFGLLFDVVRDLPIFYFKSVESMDKEFYSQPHPFDLKGCKLLFEQEKSFITLDSCVECEDEYHLKIQVKSGDKFAVQVFPTQLAQPFESVLPITHSVTVSLDPQSQVEPLILSFPHPVLCENVAMITGNAEDSSVRFSLKKGLLEPWPCDIQADEKTKWIADHLKPWIENSRSSHCLTEVKTHLDLQLKKTPSMEHSPLYSIFESIKELFLNPSASVVKIQSSPEDIWRLKVHRPVLTSPTGSPILIVSAYDSRMQKVLVGQGKMKKCDAETEFNRVISSAGQESADKEKPMVFDATPEEMLYWRYIFHLNSTKMVPTTWQKNNIPMGSQSPWLCTFISPLYNDYPATVSFIEFGRRSNVAATSGLPK